MMSEPNRSLFVPTKISTLNRFQGVLVGTALAINETQPRMMWLQTVQAIAKHLMAESTTNRSETELFVQKNDNFLASESVWERGLTVLPLVLTNIDRLQEWNVATGMAGDRPNDSNVDLLKLEANIKELPYALIPFSLATILNLGLDSTNLRQTLFKDLLASLRKNGSDSSLETVEAVRSLCRELIQSVEQALNEAQSVTVFLRRVRHVLDDFLACSPTVAIATTRETKPRHIRIAADSLLMALLLYCLGSTPEEYGISLQRLQQVLDCEHMKQFEEFQPYLKLSQKSVIATLGALLGAIGGQSSLSLAQFCPATSSVQRAALSLKRSLDSHAYTESLVWGMRLWALWSGVAPRFCLTLGESATAELGICSEFLLTSGITAPPHLIRVVGR